jgi:hypothetical protein
VQRVDQPLDVSAVIGGVATLRPGDQQVIGGVHRHARLARCHLEIILDADLLTPGDPLDDVQVQLDIELVHHLLDDLGLLHVLFAVVDRHADLERSRDAGFLEFLFGLVQVELIKRHGGVVADGARHEFVGESDAEATAHRLGNGVPIDGVVNGLAEVQVVLEGRFQGIEEVLPFVAAEGRLGVRRMGDLFRGGHITPEDVHHEVGGSGTHLIELRCGFDDDPVGDAVQVGQRLAIGAHAPVVLVALHDELVPRSKAHELEGSGADRIERQPGFAVVVGSLLRDDHRVVALGSGVAQVGEHCRAGSRQVELDRERVDHGGWILGVDRRQVVRGEALGVLDHPRQVPGRYIGGQVGAIMELHAVAQVKDNFVGGGFPRGRKRGLDTIRAVRRRPPR